MSSTDVETLDPRPVPWDLGAGRTAPAEGGEGIRRSKPTRPMPSGSWMVGARTAAGDGDAGAASSNRRRLLSARRLPPGYGLAAGAAVSLGLWAGLFTLTVRILA
jgi:hypothetical protein